MLCLFTSSGAINAERSLKNWFFRRMEIIPFPARIAVTRIRAGNCRLFPAAHPAPAAISREASHRDASLQEDFPEPDSTRPGAE